MAIADPDRLETEPQDQKDFRSLKFTDVREVAGESGVDVVAFDAKRRRRTGSFFARVATKTFEHELHHVALAVVRRRRMGEDEQFHFGLAIYDLQFTRRMNSEIVNRKS